MSGRSERWPLLIVVVGWLMLGSFTFAGLAGRSGDGWALIAILISVLTLSFWWTGHPGLRRLTAAATIAFGLVRSADYLVDGNRGPVSVWIIVAGLALSAYQISVRRDRVA